MGKLKKEFHVRNRQKLIENLPDHLLVISANSSLQKSADTAFKFRQDSNFWYLTGINEPDLLLVIDTSKNKSVLMLSEENDFKKDWDGALDKKQLKLTSGVNDILTRSDLCKVLGDALQSGLKIGRLKPLDERVEPFGFYSNPARRILEVELTSYLNDMPSSKGVTTLKTPKEAPWVLKDVRADIARLRQVKCPEEIAEIQRAVDITVEALRQVKASLSDFKNEKDIERALSIAFLQQGADGHGFDPIVAAGKNAATIHYESNDSELPQNGLLLLDISAQVGMYAADVSRTFQVGTATDRQKQVYSEVLRIHNAVLDCVKPGVMVKQLQKVANVELAKSCTKLGIEKRELPHGVSHYLGIDIHDAGDYEIPLQPGTVLTVEPGIYLPDEGIGVRIEDDVLVTKTGIKNLSAVVSTLL